MIKNRAGFTLMEVLVAFTIAGLALGSLFTLLATSKRLAWQAEQKLTETTRGKAAFNLALLHEQTAAPPPASELAGQAIIKSEGIIPPPERQTIPLPLVVEKFSVTIDGDRSEGIRLLRRVPTK